jgi:hypothetical protein
MSGLLCEQEEVERLAMLSAAGVSLQELQAYERVVHGLEVARPADLSLDLLDRLSEYSMRVGRQCEVILRADGGGELMVGISGDEFECRDSFDSMAELRDLLEGE